MADDEARDKRLKARLDQEIAMYEFRKQQRQAFMPMHRNLPDFVEMNHKNPTFVKDKNLTSTKGVAKEGKRFYG